MRRFAQSGLRVKSSQGRNFAFLRACVVYVLCVFFTIQVFAVEVYSSDITPSNETTPILLLGKPGEETSLSLADIESFGLFETKEMQHYDGPEGRFAGIWLNDLLKKYGLFQVPRLRFSALDGYEVFISKDVWQKNQYLMATRLNGEPISPENLGPLLLIIPSEVGLSEDTTVSKTLWIWAISEIIIQ
ncbi:molybdopterin-dependent oxidoreductase [Marinomonas sp.]|uniref:molybdopterin-dependent oxidoreductase n=1 Tax=Marinomonas sp. TaxID=1904862 RepID=UPI003BAAF226